MVTHEMPEPECARNFHSTIQLCLFSQPGNLPYRESLDIEQVTSGLSVASNVRTRIHFENRAG